MIYPEKNPGKCCPFQQFYLFIYLFIYLLIIELTV